MRPHRRQPTSLPRPWDSPDKNTGVGCHFFLQCMKVKSENEVAQSCPTLATPWTEAHQAPLSTGFSRQEYWSGVPLPSPYETLKYPKQVPKYSSLSERERNKPAVSQTLNSSSTLSQETLAAACQGLFVPDFTLGGSNPGMCAVSALACQALTGLCSLDIIMLRWSRLSFDVYLIRQRGCSYRDSLEELRSACCLIRKKSPGCLI